MLFGVLLSQYRYDMKKNDLAISDAVRIVELLNTDRTYQGTDEVRREPVAGDIGVVRDPYDLRNPDTSCIVEMLDSDGKTIWLANFHPDELERVDTEFSKRELPIKLYLCVMSALFILVELQSFINGYRYFCVGLNACDPAGNLIPFNVVLGREVNQLLFLAVMSVVITFFLIRMKRAERRESFTRRK